ncbi:MAG: hypothetical protein HY561_01005 [Gemmatimonadetes bacterium]|nr:hypothetical protein [Gemmatimonadota bacterium]
MTRKSRSTASAVERLLEQRRLIQEWLAKLDGSAGGSMPPQVVARVRNDYQARLTEVMTELARHGDAIRQALQEAQSRHASEEDRQREGRDELAEARLRKQVGELDEARFAERNSRVRRALGEVARELTASTRDVERYREILELIGGRGMSQSAAPAGEPEGPAATPAPAAKSAGPRRELALLRSSTTGRSEPAAAEDARPATRSPQLDLPAPRRTERPRDAGPQAKPVACAKCGTSNAATEWYCEKCGAELSAL